MEKGGRGGESYRYRVEGIDTCIYHVLCNVHCVGMRYDEHRDKSSCGLCLHIRGGHFVDGTFVGHVTKDD